MSISSLPHMHFNQAPATRRIAAAPRFLCYTPATPRLEVLNFNYHVKPQIPKNSSRSTANPCAKGFFYHLIRGNSVIKFKTRASAGPERRPAPPPRGGSGARPAPQSGASRRIPARGRARGHGPRGAGNRPWPRPRRKREAGRPGRKSEKKKEEENGSQTRTP